MCVRKNLYLLISLILLILFFVLNFLLAVINAIFYRFIPISSGLGLVLVVFLLYLWFGSKSPNKTLVMISRYLNIVLWVLVFLASYMCFFVCMVAG
jgi:hypothetical protein